MNPEPKLICDQASVKVMRSFDYCHFEICLTMNEEGAFYSSEAVDNLRKEAMRLADKAVEQYKKAKRAAGLKEELAGRKWQLDVALACPENERSPEQKAVIKFHQDAEFASRFDYDYEDDWEEPL